MGRLFWKILLSFWLTMVLIGVAIGVFVHLYNEARIAGFTGVASGPLADLAVVAFADQLEKGGRPGVESLISEWPHGRAPILMVDGEGRDMFGRPVPAAAFANARERLAGGNAAPGVRRVRAPGGGEYVLFLPVPRGPGPEHHGPRLPPRDIFMLRIAITLFAGLIFSAALAWYLTRPIRHLRRATRMLAAGALQTRVGPAMGSRRDEITDLGRDFDDMAARLDALVGAQKRLFADVSHELRSPLARLQVAVAIARQQPERTADSLDRMEREARRLDHLVGEILSLAQLETGVAGAGEEYLDLVGLLEEVVENARFEAEPAGKRVELQATGELVVNARAELLRRAFDNVVRNAVRFTAAGTAVEVAAKPAADGTTVVVTICDRGPGVPDQDLESIFKPFFRAGGGQGRDGHGLGLAIARRAVEAHAGRIRAYNRPGGGLCVEIALNTVPAVSA